MRTLVAIPVYNERGYVRSVLDRVLQQKRDAAARGQELDVLIVDDGSTDGAAEIASEYPVNLCRRVENMGYGRSMRDAFDWSIRHGYDWLITMDCDEQHEPTSIPDFLSAQQAADARGGTRGGTRGGASANRARNEHARSDQVPGHASGADIISGTRYLRASTGLDRPPADRRQINLTMTAEINARLSGRLGCILTDSFCGFKSYRVSSLAKLDTTVDGYAFPMQFWVQAAAQRLRVVELPVRLIYNDPNRTFGGGLDDPERRLRHYRRVLHRELLRHRELMPTIALRGLANWAQRAQLVIEQACGKQTSAGDGSSVGAGRNAGTGAAISAGASAECCDNSCCNPREGSVGCYVERA